MSRYPIGTVSHGTMRNEDLIPDFIWELKNLSKKHKTFIKEVQERIDTMDDYYSSEESDYDLESLSDKLNECAGPYFYFGAHPGDGSDYGFWLNEMFQEDFEGLKVSDLSEIPKPYFGEVLTEIWAIV